MSTRPILLLLLLLLPHFPPGHLESGLNRYDLVNSTLKTSLNIYPSNVTFSLNLSSAEVHVSNDGRFVYASMRNLTDASLIGTEDVSFFLFFYFCFFYLGCEGRRSIIIIIINNISVLTTIYLQPSDTIAVWAADPSTGTLTRIQDAMAFGARQIRSFELSPAGTTASAGGQVSPRCLEMFHRVTERG